MRGTRRCGCVGAAVLALCGPALFAATSGSPAYLPLTAPVTLDLVLPAAPKGKAEPLVATGEGGRGDTALVRYEAADEIRFGWASSELGVVYSEPIKVAPGPHRLLVSMGSLIPPAGAGDPDARVAPLRSLFLLQFDGRTVMRVPGEFQPVTTADRVALGFNRVGSPLLQPFFGGQILAAKALAPTVALAEAMQVVRWLPAPAAAQGGFPGAVHLRLRFPRDPSATADPLIVTGSTGKGDFIYVQVVDPQHVRFGFDHWGVGGIAAPPVAVDLGAIHDLVIVMGDLDAPRGPSEGAQPVEVWLDGQPVLSGRSEFYRTAPGQIILGYNLIGGSTTGNAYRGTFLKVEPATAAELARLRLRP